MQLQVTLSELDAFAATFWKVAGNTKVFAFHGTLGAGKTTTIAALCRYKGVHEALSSPTFSIINEYRFEADGTPQTIYHIDLYRLKSEEEIVQAGVEDCVYSGALCFVEWPDKAPYLFEEAALHVLLEPESETARRVNILTPEAYKKLSVAEQL